MKSKGFTLIELMIVLAIIFIIASVAYPLLFGSKSTSDYGIPQGEVHVQQPASVYSCVNGVLVNGAGEPFVQNGAAVTCK